MRIQAQQNSSISQGLIQGMPGTGEYAMKMLRMPSPLRYPGAKTVMIPLMLDAMAGGYTDHTFIEPFAGGASLSLGLLYAGAVKDVVLNDLDPRIWAFWRTAIDRPRELADRLRSASPSRELHAHCTEVMKSSTQVYEIGFATICSNLLSFGGMLCGTFTVREKNSRALLIAADKLDRLAAYTDRITLHRSDAVSLMDRYKSADRVLLYVDPPYYEVGNSLYAVGMSPHAHSRLASWLAGHRHLSWVLSYDDHPTVRALYKSCNIARARWAYYSTKHDVNGAELIITSDTAPTFAAGRYGRMEILP